MTHEPITITKDTPVRVDKIVDCVIDEQEREHTVCVGIAYQEYFRRNKVRIILSIDCFTVDPKHVEQIPSFDDQVREIIRERLGEETEFQHDKITMI